MASPSSLHESVSKNSTAVPAVRRKKAVRVAWNGYADQFWGPDELSQLHELVDTGDLPLTAEELLARPDLLAELEIIIGTWGMPLLDAGFLAMAPRLEAVFFGAGSVRGFTSDAFWRSGIKLSGSYALNAIPVAEYCVATILLSLKGALRHMLRIREEKRWSAGVPVRPPGAYHSSVGLVSMGSIGRKTVELLRPYDVRIKAFCITLTEEKARDLGIGFAQLDEIFSTCDVISLHTALVPETRGLINRALLARMKPNATLINSSRGAIISQNDLVEVMRERPDLTSVLDVTDPEPPADGDPILDLPNVFLTPHISGSMYNECRRLGQNTIDECRRYLAGKPLQWEIDKALADRMA